MCLLRVQKLNPLLLHPWNISLIQMVDFAFFFLSFVRTVLLSWLQPVFDSCFRFKAGSFRGHSGLKPTLSPVSLFLPTPRNLSQPTFSRLWKILICVSLDWKFIISYLAWLKRFFPIFYKVHWSLNGKVRDLLWPCRPLLSFVVAMDVMFFSSRGPRKIKLVNIAKVTFKWLILWGVST